MCLLRITRARRLPNISSCASRTWYLVMSRSLRLQASRLDGFLHGGSTCWVERLDRPLHVVFFQLRVFDLLRNVPRNSVLLDSLRFGLHFIHRPAKGYMLSN